MKDIIHKRTVDKGWKLMRDQLDLEMPEKRKKRRWGWWWFFGLLLAVAVWGVRAWINASDIPPATPNAGMAAKTNPTRSETVGKAPENHPSAQQKDSYSTTNQPIEARSTATLNINPQQAPQVSSTAAVTVDTISESVLVANEYPVKSPDATFIFNCLPQHAIQPLFIPHSIEAPLFTVHAPMETTPTKPAIVQRKTLRVGGSVWASTDEGSSVNALSAGVHLQWQAGKRLGARTGLYLTHYKPSRTLQPVSVINAGDYSTVSNFQFDVTDPNGNVVSPYNGSPALGNLVTVPVTRLYMLDMPLLANWVASRKWDFQAGLQQSFVIKAVAASTNYSDELVLSLNRQSVRTAVSRLLTQQLDRWRLEALFGTTFKLGHRVELGMNLRIPLLSRRLNQSAAEMLQNNSNGGSNPDPNALDSGGRYRSDVLPAFLTMGINYRW